jgi:ferritin
MLKEKIEKALNEQLKWEIYSAYLYLSMAAYFESINLKGFSHWMKMQFQEELNHAMKFFDYITERGGRVRLGDIKRPPSDWNSPLDAFEATYKHEVHVTSRINQLVELALEEKDHATYNMLQWFVTEQVEEEASADEIVQKLRMVGDRVEALLMMDRELAQRQPPQMEGESHQAQTG